MEMTSLRDGADRSIGIIWIDVPGRYIVTIEYRDGRDLFSRLSIQWQARNVSDFFIPKLRRISYLLESTEGGLRLEFDSADVVASTVRAVTIGDFRAFFRWRYRRDLFGLPLGKGVTLRPLLHMAGPEGRAFARALRGLAGWGLGFASDGLQKTLLRHFDGPVARIPNRLSTSNSKIAVVIHLHYRELWPEFEALLAVLDRPFQLILTLTEASPEFEGRVRAVFEDAEIVVYGNRGRDVGPFVQLLRDGRLDRFDLVCKLHGKKSALSGPRMALGEIWRLANLYDLLGSRDVVDRIVDEFGQSLDTGMIGSRRFRLPNTWKTEDAAWGRNKSTILGLLEKLGMPPDSKLDFFAGTMFWVRRSTLEPLKRLDLSMDSFPYEEGQQDGTLQHALERIFGMISQNKSGVTWD